MRARHGVAEDFPRCWQGICSGLDLDNSRAQCIQLGRESKPWLRPSSSVQSPLCRLPERRPVRQRRRRVGVHASNARSPISPPGGGWSASPSTTSPPNHWGHERPPIGPLWPLPSRSTLRTMPLPRLYTPEEVAEQLGHVSPYTLRRLVAQGRVSCHRASRNKVVFSEGDVLALLEYFARPAAPAHDREDDDEVFHFSSKSGARQRSRKWEATGV